MAIGIEKHSGHNLETTALVIKENTQRKKTHTNTLFLLGRKSPSPRQHPQTKKKHSLTPDNNHNKNKTTKMVHPKSFIIVRANYERPHRAPLEYNNNNNNLVPSLEMKKKIRKTIANSLQL